MAQPALNASSSARNVIGESAEPQHKEESWVDDDPIAAALSPARAMQRTLGREYGMLEEAEAEGRWPLRYTVAMVFTSCGAFWTAVYFAVAALVG